MQRRVGNILRGDGALDPVTGIRDGGFDLRQIVDTQKFELGLERASEIGTHMRQRVIMHRASAQVEIVFGGMQHRVTRSNAGMIVQTLRKKLRNAAEPVADVGLKRAAMLIVQAGQRRSAQRMHDMCRAEQPIRTKPSQRSRVNLRQGVEQRRIIMARRISCDGALILPAPS